MKAWKYVAPTSVLLLAKKDDFDCLPAELQDKYRGLPGTAWNNRPGNPLPEMLVGASRSDVETALAGQGWYKYP
jgi:uncharacterized protein YcgL (UPF0745 family)